MTRVANCSTTRLSRRQELRKFKSSVSLVSGNFSTDPVMRSCLTRWVDINSGDENKPFYRSRLVVQEYKRQADWSFSPATPPLEALRSLLICGTIEELSNDVGQPVAWTEPVVLMLIDVRRAHFYSAARRSLCGAFCGSLHGQEQSWPFAQEHVWMQRRWSELGNCALPSHDCNWFRAS